MAGAVCRVYSPATFHMIYGCRSAKNDPFARMKAHTLTWTASRASQRAAAAGVKSGGWTLIFLHTLQSTVILRLAYVVQNSTGQNPVSRMSKRLVTAYPQSQLLQAAEAPLENADGVLRAHTKTSHLIVAISPIGDSGFRSFVRTKCPVSVLHGLVAEQVLPIRNKR